MHKCICVCVRFLVLFIGILNRQEKSDNTFLFNVMLDTEQYEFFDVNMSNSNKILFF